MNISTNENVKDFLSDLHFTSPEHLDRVILIRDIFFKTNKNLGEEIKYGGLLFINPAV